MCVRVGLGVRGRTWWSCNVVGGGASDWSAGWRGREGVKLLPPVTRTHVDLVSMVEQTANPAYDGEECSWKYNTSLPVPVEKQLYPPPAPLHHCPLHYGTSCQHAGLVWLASAFYGNFETFGFP